MPVHKVKSNATNADLQKSIERILPIAAAQPEAKKLAIQLRGATEYQTCKNIFDWVLTNIKYVKDGEHQVVRLPSGILRTRQGDCKSMTVLVCSLLTNNGIKPVLVYTSYRENPTPTHIYCQTESGIILDPVWRKFNSEKKPRHKFVKSTNNMNISYLSGIGAAKKPLINLKKAGGIIKQVAPPVVIGRTLFLTIIRNNLDGIATKLSTGNRENQIATWRKAGGDGKALAEAIQKGASKPARKIGFLGKLKGRLKKKKISGFMGAVETDDEALKKGIAAISTALGASVGSVVPGAGTAAGGGAGAALGSVMVVVLPIIKEAIAKTADADIVPEETPIAPPTDIIAPPAENVTTTVTTTTAAAPTNTIVKSPDAPELPPSPQVTAPAVPGVPTSGKNNMLLIGAAAVAAILLLRK